MRYRDDFGNEASDISWFAAQNDTWLLGFCQVNDVVGKLAKVTGVAVDLNNITAQRWCPVDSAVDFWGMVHDICKLEDDIERGAQFVAYGQGKLFLAGPDFTCFPLGHCQLVVGALQQAVAHFQGFYREAKLLPLPP